MVRINIFVPIFYQKYINSSLDVICYKNTFLSVLNEINIMLYLGFKNIQYKILTNLRCTLISNYFL